jgi:CDP-diacylglycerol--serine O-phosphatidyltransferase
MPPLRYFVPNSFTAASLVLGLASVVMSVRGNFELAAWMVLWGTLLDKADGTLARLFNATSAFGVEFDSFADFVAFGVAPAALVYFRLESRVSLALLAPAAGLYVVALAVRLARFNITTGGEKIFTGIPGTMMGAVVAAGFLTATKYRLPDPLFAWFPVLLVVGAFAMVSSINLPKLKAYKSKAFNVFQFSNVAAAYVVGPLMLVPEYLLGLALVYLFGGIGYCLIHPEEPQRVAPEPEQRDSEEQLAA